MEQIFLTRKEAAALLRISQPTLLKLIKSGAVPSFKAGRFVRIKKSDLLGITDPKPVMDVKISGKDISLFSKKSN